MFYARLALRSSCVNYHMPFATRLYCLNNKQHITLLQFCMYFQADDIERLYKLEKAKLTKGKANRRLSSRTICNNYLMAQNTLLTVGINTVYLFITHQLNKHSWADCQKIAAIAS